MGEYLSQPIRDKISSNEENGSVIYGASAMQGWRKKMEDTHLINLKLVEGKSFCLFGVFDGHGGDEVANYVKKHFAEVLCSRAAFKEKKYETALKETFMELDELLLKEEAKKELIELSKNGKEVKEGIDNAKKEEDRQLELFKSLFDPRNLEDCNIAMFTGCTACICLIVDNEVYLANAGDSKALIIKEGKEPCIQTKEHRPTDKDEENRVINANGVIEDKKINGVIDLSRCIGDLEYKKDKRLKPNKQILIAEPDVIQVPIKEVDYVVLGCDGFWDYKVDDKAKKEDKNSKIENRVKADIKAKKTEEKYSEIIERIFDFILDTDKDKKDKIDNKDNMTCIIIQIKEEAKIEKPKEEPKVEKKEEEPKPPEMQKVEEKPKEMIIDDSVPKMDDEKEKEPPLEEKKELIEDVSVQEQPKAEEKIIEPPAEEEKPLPQSEVQTEQEKAGENNIEKVDEGDKSEQVNKP